MKFTNYQIYQYANELYGIFNNKEIYIPVKANFLIQKNIQILVAAAQEIEKARLDIVKHYGDLTGDNQQYTIPPAKIKEASEELNDLFNIEQELPIRTFTIDALGNAEFSTAQMQAIMFMISEEE